MLDAARYGVEKSSLFYGKFLLGTNGRVHNIITCSEHKSIELDLESGCRTVSNNGLGSGLAPAQNILAVQVWFGFI